MIGFEREEEKEAPLEAPSWYLLQFLGVGSAWSARAHFRSGLSQALFGRELRKCTTHPIEMGQEVPLYLKGLDVVSYLQARVQVHSEQGSFRRNLG